MITENPLSVACPHCGAVQGQTCDFPGAPFGRQHKARWHAVNVDPKPRDHAVFADLLACAVVLKPKGPLL